MPAAPSRLTRARSRLDPWVAAGVVALLALEFVALFGERFAPYEPIYFVVQHGGDPRPFDPGLVFPLGSDALGRDLFSVVLAGARATLTIVLVAGLARVIAGTLVAAAGAWRPARIVTETVADLVAAVPATLVALLLVKAFVAADADVLVLVAALLVVGWAGPYRVIRAEVDRLSRAPFTDGARAIGLRPLRIFWRHHVPHLVPVIATNATQQVVASLVLVAELGVLGVLVGAVRRINVEESMTRVLVGPPPEALISDTPEWGAMLAGSRSTEALWATRWLILVPGAAFALAAMAVALVGFAMARRYARRDVFRDARGFAFVAAVVAVLFAASAVVPERYAAAREWSAAARADVGAGTSFAAALADAGVKTTTVERRVPTIVRTGPATVRVGASSVTELYPQPTGAAASTIRIRSLVTSSTGGGVVEAPLVFAARGIDPSQHPPRTAYARQFATTPDLGRLIQDYPNDYAAVDVRGKVVLLVRFTGVDSDDGFAEGFAVQATIDDAIRRGAAAIIFVDQDVGDTPRVGGRAVANPYVVLERANPPLRASGVPVVVVHPADAQALVAPYGIDIAGLIGYDQMGKTFDGSPARDLPTTARVEVPLRQETRTVTSSLGVIQGPAADTAHVAVWAARDLESEALDAARVQTLAAVAKVAAARAAPFVFVDFDAHADSAAVRDALAGLHITLVLLVGPLDRDTLSFKTANGDLIPAFDLYARRASARFETTRQTASIGAMVMPLGDVRTVEIESVGDPGDARGDAAAVIGYVAGRLALGAPEVPR